MNELVELEAQHAEFEKRKTRVVVASLEGEGTAQTTQAQFPHLLVVSDHDRNLANAVAVIHEHSSPEGEDTTAPTTLLVDGKGVIHWTFRPDRYLARIGTKNLLKAIDEHLHAN